MDKLAHALAWAARGFRVFPLLPGRSDAPLLAGWPDLATTDPATIEAWWRDGLTGYVQPYNVGVCTTGLAVVDLDNHAGQRGRDEWEESGGSFDTLTVRTPSGGFHLYYIPTRPIPNSASKVAAGVDLRGERGYVVAPGSERPDGAYELVIDAPVAVLPRWVEAAAGAAPSLTRNAGPAVDLDTLSAIANAIAYLQHAAPAIEGMGGDARTYQVACEVRDRGVSAPIALDLMLAHWNERCEPPWQADELQAKVENAYAYAQRAEGEKHPAAVFGGVQIIEPERVVPVGAATAWAWGNIPDLDRIPPRPWVLRGALLQGDITALLAPGAVGKSLLALQIAVAFALGDARILGFDNIFAGVPRPSMIYNAEDSVDEMALRIHAICRQRQVSVDRVRPYLSLTSGKAYRFRLSQGRDRPEPNVPEINRFLEAAAQARPVLAAFDPFVKLHDSPENDNTSMGAVMDTVVRVAEAARIAALLAHHTPKMGGESHAGNAEAGRGARTIIDSARIAFTLETMTAADAAEHGISPAERRRFLRLDNARAGRTIGDEPTTWLRRESVALRTTDEVGVLVPADLAGRQAQAHLSLAQRAIQWIEQTDRAAAPFADVVRALKMADPLLREMTLAAASAHIEAVFSSPIETEMGTIYLDRASAKKVLALR